MKRVNASVLAVALVVIVAVFAVAIVAITQGDDAGSTAPELGEVDKQMAVDAAAASKSAAADPHNQACERLARTWLVKAKRVNSTLAIGLYEKTQDLLGLMTDATEQMEVDQCEGLYREPALRGNYQAALAIGRLLRCDSDDLDCALDVAETWTERGAPFVGQVNSLVG